MTRDEAMKLADAMVTAWIANPPTNARGYADGVKIPTIQERADSVIKLAEFLWDVPADDQPPTPVELMPHPATLFGWVVGSDTCPTPGQYRQAKAAVARVGPDTIVTAAEAAALASLIGTYESLAPRSADPS